jgi:hypothetical protein
VRGKIGKDRKMEREEKRVKETHTPKQRLYMCVYVCVCVWVCVGVWVCVCVCVCEGYENMKAA